MRSASAGVGLSTFNHVTPCSEIDPTLEPIDRESPTKKPPDRRERH
jgi:hypothetical protein